MVSSIESVKKEAEDFLKYLENDKAESVKSSQDLQTNTNARTEISKKKMLSDRGQTQDSFLKQYINRPQSMQLQFGTAL